MLIALLGIANTLALSVFERTRELGLLRAVGMGRRQMRAMVRWESVIIALFGTGMGLAIGLCFSWALVKAGPDQATLTVPVGQLAAIILVAALAGVVAAILPARRASRLNVLAAIATRVATMVGSKAGCPDGHPAWRSFGQPRALLWRRFASATRNRHEDSADRDPLAAASCKSQGRC